MFDVLIADDHPLVREALGQAVANALGGADLRFAHDMASLVSELERTPAPDLLLLDLQMPGALGFSALAHVRGMRPGVPVLVVSGRDDADTRMRALAFGAQGFVSKAAPSSDVGDAVRVLINGGRLHAQSARVALDPEDEALKRALGALSPAQFRVLSAVCQGQLNKQIAADLAVTEATIKAHMTQVMRRLGTRNRTQTVLKLARLVLDADRNALVADLP